MRLMLGLAVAGVLGVTLAALASRHEPAPPPAFHMAYGDAKWDALVRESYRATGQGEPRFDRWIESSWQRVTGHTLAAWIDAKTGERAKLTIPERVAWELDLGREVHRIFKAIAPHFNLDRGFEFAQLARRKERQCLLQSVVISAVLSRAGVPSGIVMVWKSPQEAESNMGHAVAMAMLSDGRRALIDASEAQAYLAPRGIFAVDGKTHKGCFFEVRQGLAGGFRHAMSLDGKPSHVEPLPSDFVRSQFAFYRAERAPGGLASAHPTPQGLNQSERLMGDAISACGWNPLARYSLARIHEKQGRADTARPMAISARALYEKAGYIPPGVAELASRLERDSL